jgi:ABC-type transport system substrate-binding protein
VTLPAPNPSWVYTPAWTLDNDVNIAQVISAELAKVGINARVKAVTLAAAEVTATGPAGKRPASFWGGGCITPDVSGYDFYLGSANLASGQWNEAAWAPPAVDRWLAEGTTTDDRAARFAAFCGIVRQMSADVPYVPLYLQDVSVAISSKFSYPGYSFWYYLANAYALGIKANP